MSAEPSPSRRWLIMLPFAAFALIVACWSAAWLYIRAEVERRMDNALRQEAARGHAHACPSRDVGGYPFRIDITCANAVAVFDTPAGPAEARVARITVTALVYRPNHVIADLTGPLTITQNGATVVTLTFERGLASYSGTLGPFDRFSLVLDKAKLDRSPVIPADAAAAHIELHARRSGAHDFDVAASARDLSLGAASPGQGMTLDWSGVLRGVPESVQPNGSGLIAEWARGGGRFDLTQGRAARGAGLLVAQGTLGFNANGRAQAAYQAVVVDLAALLGGFNLPGLGDPSRYLGPVLAIVGRPGEVEGRRGTKVEVHLDNGALSIGAVQLGEFAPVF